jgi:hypothetical protein
VRKNIFEILANDNNLHQEMETIWKLFTKPLCVDISVMFLFEEKRKSILDCVNIYSFKNWKSRKQCISPDDMMNRLGINDIFIKNMNVLSDKTLDVLEFIINMIERCDVAISNNSFSVTGDYVMLKENLNVLIENFGYTTYTFEDEEKVIIIEKSPAVISAAEISEPEIGKKIIQYNHYTLKGNIDAKKDIILALASELEPQRKELNQINSSLESDLFLMFNNLNLRHNNIESSDKNYKPFIAQMDKTILENWYDDLYQMILLAKLLLDNKERQNRIKELKDNL